MCCKHTCPHYTIQNPLRIEGLFLSPFCLFLRSILHCDKYYKPNLYSTKLAKLTKLKVCVCVSLDIVKCFYVLFVNPEKILMRYVQCKYNTFSFLLFPIETEILYVTLTKRKKNTLPRFVFVAPSQG